MGISTAKRFKSIISFEKAWVGTEDDLPFFRGTISCGSTRMSHYISRSSEWEIDEDEEEHNE